MSLWRRRSVTLALATLSVLVTHGYNLLADDTTQITLSMDSNNKCVQNGVLGGRAEIGKTGAKWVGPTGTESVQVVISPRFLSSCPFSTCSPAAGTSVTSGSTEAASGTWFKYNSIMIGGKACKVSGAGLIMK